MALDAQAVAAMLPQMVPMVATLHLAIDEVEPRRAVLRLPEQPAFHNHLAGPHAGAMFTLGESASGALVMANFGDRLAEATPLAVEASIRYLKLAMGEITATATMDEDAADVLVELAAGERPEFSVEITFTDAVGLVTGEMTVRWTLKPTRR